MNSCMGWDSQIIYTIIIWTHILNKYMEAQVLGGMESSFWPLLEFYNTQDNTLDAQMQMEIQYLDRF